MTAIEKLYNKTNQKFHICLGLDSDIEKIPHHLSESENPILDFNREIIAHTSDLVSAYKINLAFYENTGANGYQVLQKTIEMIPDDILIIGDAKRGDIGNTAKKYAESLFDHFGFDASTLNPYMGYDSLKPFLDYKDKLNFILALTSNPSNADFEKLRLEGGEYLYQSVIKKVTEWDNRNCGFVFGATNSTELENNIERFDKMPVLLPGVGSQGGSLKEVVKLFKNAEHSRFIINISRGLIYAGSASDFAIVTREKLISYNKEVREIFN